MGLYDDLQDDISSAFDGDLSDAVKAIELKVETVGGYDPLLGPTSTFSSYETRGVVTKSEVYKNSNAALSEGYIDVLILDSEKVIDDFVMEMDVVVGGKTYEVKGIEVDPAGATHTLTCRPKNAY